MVHPFSNQNGYLKITEQDLEDIIKFASNKAVGKILKRFEIHDNAAKLKVEVKEQLYEAFRDTRDLLLACAKGLKPKVYNFNNEGKSISP